ncbi:MAG: NAD(P)/FAD-dependent oxidoreductase [Methanosarcinaceae archaeon]|nr:NAD(P)/FAD-dependent oxidoreductase [Methanosarcinaceae archaeon]
MNNVTKPRVIIIGAGLGGLLSAAKLAMSGYEVEVFERLPMIGGRFTNIEYKGFALSTGALHMLPHGPSGPLAQMLKSVGADVNIVRSDPMALIRIPSIDGDNDYKNGSKDILFKNFPGQLSKTNRLKIAVLMLTTRVFPPKKDSLEEWFSRYIKDEWLVKLADSFCGWSLSLRGADTSVKEAFSIFSNMYRYSGPGVPIGGCKAVADALADVITSNGSTIHTGKDVSEIIVKDGKAVGILVDGTEHFGDIVISNIGHVETNRLYNNIELSEEYNQYLEQLKNIKPSAGVKICLAADEPLIGHGGVLLTPYARRVNGINEVTNIDPNLAPPGKHLAVSHQCVQWDNLDELEQEIELGLQDIKEIFAGKKYEVLLIQSYSGEWPVNRSASGLDVNVKNSTPFKNLFIVGDGAKGEGGIEVEGIALGVANVMERIL